MRFALSLHFLNLFISSVENYLAFSVLNLCSSSLIHWIIIIILVVFRRTKRHNCIYVIYIYSTKSFDTTAPSLYF